MSAYNTPYSAGITSVGTGTAKECCAETQVYSGDRAAKDVLEQIDRVIIVKRQH